MTDAFAAEVLVHDAALDARGLQIWVGAEPTFTDRYSNDPEWLHTPLGGDKEARARALLAALHTGTPGALVLRSEGRRYFGEEQPRWNYGLLSRRNGQTLWHGTPDPLLLSGTAATAAEAHRVTLDDFNGDVTACLEALQRLEAESLMWPTLIVGGATPPVDRQLALTTVTPDPAVVEVNSAPSASAFEFLMRSRQIYAAAAAVALSPYRLQFNGNVNDSGGGGQITLGGPSPELSPFVLQPRLLPRVLRYFNRHPALSYLYCHDFAGPGGQSVRSDERGLAQLDELQLALAWLDHQPPASAEQVWQTLAPFLSDSAGNSHRAELNVEKLSNPDGGPRGRLGLLEFRALRMQHSPERATALACLLRAILALLHTTDDRRPLIDWGRELHDRFALPFYLQQDLRAVLAELAAAGLGLGPALQQQLLADEFRHMARVSLPGAELELWRALEFWPLLGDATSPGQNGSSRLIDSSTTRIELRLRPLEPASTGWQLLAGGQALPMHAEIDADGPVWVAGLRYRAFAPQRGLHPALPAQTPLEVKLQAAQSGPAWLLSIHEWQPQGLPYPGLPVDTADAANRRAERVCWSQSHAERASAAATSGWTLDLRWPSCATRS